MRICPYCQGSGYRDLCPDCFVPIEDFSDEHNILEGCPKCGKEFPDSEYIREPCMECCGTGERIQNDMQDEYESYLEDIENEKNKVLKPSKKGGCFSVVLILLLLGMLLAY